jgi:hypothetical protein
MSGTHEAAPQRHLSDAQCADLVVGLVPARVREAWLDHAAGCETCEARLKSHASAAERARADGLARASKATVAFPGAWRGTPWIALAAAAVLAVAVALPLLNPVPVPELGPPWLPAFGESVRTREGDAEDPRLTAGMRAYEAHDLMTAERELAAARATGATESMRRLYLAHARLALGQPRSSIELLRSLNWRSIPEPYRREGAVLLARALRANGEGSAADTIESTLRRIPRGTPFLP